MRGADDTAMKAGQGDDTAPPAADTVGHLGYRSDFRVLLIVPRHQEDARLA